MSPERKLNRAKAWVFSSKLTYWWSLWRYLSTFGRFCPSMDGDKKMTDYSSSHLPTLLLGWDHGVKMWLPYMWICSRWASYSVISYVQFLSKTSRTQEETWPKNRLNSTIPRLLQVGHASSNLIPWPWYYLPSNLTSSKRVSTSELLSVWVWNAPSLELDTWVNTVSTFSFQRHQLGDWKLRNQY